MIKVIGHHAYKLELPRGIRLHHVVHTTMLKPFKAREGDDNEVDDEENELFFEVDAILDSKRFGRTVKYRVHWKGYDEADDTWQPIETLQGVVDIIKEFHRANPRAPQDPIISTE